MGLRRLQSNGSQKLLKCIIKKLIAMVLPAATKATNLSLSNWKINKNWFRDEPQKVAMHSAATKGVMHLFGQNW